MPNFKPVDVNDEQTNRMELLGELADKLLSAIILYCPAGRSRSIACTKLDEAMMWANRAIARNE